MTCLQKMFAKRYAEPKLILITILVFFAASVASHNILAAGNPKPDLTQASLEQLLELEVLTASKIARQVSDAPSAVSIVTAEDIKAYGYRTLAEVLNSMRGLNISNDRAYDFLGGRGYSSPGDYSGRIMLLIDGVQMNDNAYNQSYLGNDGVIDTELIERVEYVSGPGSVAYGNNAFFGIINVITKNGVDFDGAQAALSVGSYHTQKARLSYGKHLANDIDLLISASGFNSEGQNLYFPEFNDGNPANNNGIARNQDAQRNQRLFAKIQGNAWSVETGYGQRRKDLPNAPYGADFNNQYFYDDASKFISGQYHIDLSKYLKLSLQTDYSDYFYHGKTTFDGESWQERTAGKRWGTEAKFVGSWFTHHQLVFGIAYRDDYQRKFSTPAITSDHGRQATSLYIQDEITMRDNLWLNLGSRYDHFTDDGSSISPRIALIYEPIPSYTLRLSHSIAHRTPTAFEKYYTDGETQTPNPSLKTERVAASELIIERRWNNQSRVLASLYNQTTDNSISNTPYNLGVIQYFNAKGSRTEGIELEFEHHAKDGTRLRTSYAYQNSKNYEGGWAANSPHHLGKFNLSVPMLSNAIRAGLEVQAVSPRSTGFNRQVSGYTLTNLTLGSDRVLKNLDVAISVRNLFDKRYEHIAPDYATPITAIEQDGRNFWLQLTYGFK
ncbi:MAG: TonB-dependent receptor [Methylotenera sp.]|nr:TonB-dependent receptor [Methylotenera sp.]